MIEGGDRLRLAFEPLFHFRIFRKLSGKNLDRNRSVQPCVSSLLYLAYSAGARLLEYLVWP
jgi:hypothetical protein